MPVIIHNHCKRIIALAVILFHFTISAQINCDNDSTLLIPIVDLQSDFYMGYQGGLYEAGSNIMPAAHADSGILIAQNLIPLNFDGDADTVFGKTVFLGLGSISAGRAFNKFLSQYDNAGYHDSCVRIVNGCLSDFGMETMIDDEAGIDYWKDVNAFLQSANVKKRQVSVIWIMTTSFVDSVENMSQYVDTLSKQYIELIKVLKSEFTNLKMIYFSGLQYGGYLDLDSEQAHAFAEPGPYYNDFAIKATISAQINGDSLLNYSGGDLDAAWAAWGPNFWADGRNLREYDSLRWLCPGDYLSDENGILLSGTGEQKMADRLFEFFTTDATSTPWIFGQPYDCFTEIEVEEIDSLIIPDDVVVYIIQNPVKGVVKFVINLQTNEKADVMVFNSMGQKITEGAFYKIEPGKIFDIKLNENHRGIYILSVQVEGKVYNIPFYLNP